MGAPATHPGRRSRPVYAGAVVVVIALGLWSRSDAAALPWASPRSRPR